MVSRKERRIKLKRFRDNEMTEPVVTDGLSRISIYEASGSDTRQLPILPIVLSDGQIVWISQLKIPHLLGADF